MENKHCYCDPSPMKLLKTPIHSQLPHLRTLKLKKFTNKVRSPLTTHLKQKNQMLPKRLFQLCSSPSPISLSSAAAAISSSKFSVFPSKISIFAFWTGRPLVSSLISTVEVMIFFSTASPLFFRISATVTTVAIAIPRADSSTSLCCCMYLLARLT
uniref:Uncharacterized protein n=1 Tax=Rhizophora mucronata TaxID=61149 RepID=A0A2P2K9I2_RHIMU